MPMTDAEEISRLQEQLAAHRATLAILLRQLASLGSDYAPPGVHHGIAEARAAIERLKEQLRAAGLAVDDQAGDQATADEAAAAPVDAPARGVRQTIEGGDHSIQAIDSTVTVDKSGDQIDARGSQGFINRPSGPVIQNIGTHYHRDTPARPTIDLAAAQARLAELPLDLIPAPAALPPLHRMTLRANPQFVGRDDDLK